jgi:hypothetical protein
MRLSTAVQGWRQSKSYYRFEACAATADGVLWSDPLHAAAGASSPPHRALAHSHELLLDFVAEAKDRLRETS